MPLSIFGPMRLAPGAHFRALFERACALRYCTGMRVPACAKDPRSSATHMPSGGPSLQL